MSPCYFLFSQGFSPKLSCDGPMFTTWQVPYSFLFTFTLLHYFYLPNVFQIVFLPDLASLPDSCSSVIFIYMQCGPFSVCDHSLKMRLKELVESFSYISYSKSSRRTSFLLKSAYKLRHRPLQQTASLTMKMV